MGLSSVIPLKYYKIKIVTKLDRFYKERQDIHIGIH